MSKSIFNIVGVMAGAALISTLSFVGCGNPDAPIANPDPPTGVSATANSTNSVIVGWGFVSGATGYYIYRSQDAVGPYVQVGKSETTSYTDNGLSAGITYYYRVAAYNSKGTGSQSSYVTTTTLPNAPTGVTATAALTSSITITWSSVSGATYYYIYRSTSASGTYEKVGTYTATSYTDNSLSAGTTYYYKVTAGTAYGGGESAQSNYVSATTLPNAPTDVTATANSAGSITVSWTAVSGVDGYYIYRSTNAFGTYEQVGASTTTSYTNTSLEGSTTYYYKVTAYNSGGESAQSNYVSKTTMLNAPTNVKATAASSSSINVSWSPVQDATYYYIYRSTSASGTYEQVGTSQTTTYTDKGLSAGTTYYYKVAVGTTYGGGSEENAQSNYVSVTTTIF